MENYVEKEFEAQAMNMLKDTFSMIYLMDSVKRNAVTEVLLMVILKTG